METSSNYDRGKHQEPLTKLIGGVAVIKKINRALERLNNGDFGVCEECGREISEERLMARPMAVLCIRCKRKEEAVGKIRGL